MDRPVRVLHGFYEAQGEFAVPKDRAYEIMGRSLDIVGRYVGTLALESWQGVRIPTAGDPLNTNTVRFGNQRHNLVLTRRMFIGKNGSVIGKHLDLALPQGTTGTTTFVRDEPLLLPLSIGTAVHELGHSFGLTHCDEPCIMQQESDPQAIISLLDRETFCGNCAGELELATQL